MRNSTPPDGSYPFLHEDASYLFGIVAPAFERVHAADPASQTRLGCRRRCRCRPQSWSGRLGRRDLDRNLCVHTSIAATGTQAPARSLTQNHMVVRHQLRLPSAPPFRGVDVVGVLRPPNLVRLLLRVVEGVVLASVEVPSAASGSTETRLHCSL